MMFMNNNGVFNRVSSSTRNRKVYIKVISW